jgi:hypothetical protein
MVHLDNARRHNSRKSQEVLTGIKSRRIITPAYIPDFSLSFFFVFGMVKKRMSGSSYSILHELIFAISGVIA